MSPGGQFQVGPSLVSHTDMQSSVFGPTAIITFNLYSVELRFVSDTLPCKSDDQTASGEPHNKKSPPASI